MNMMGNDQPTELIIHAPALSELFSEREFDPFNDHATGLQSIAQIARFPNLTASLARMRLRVTLPAAEAVGADANSCGCCDRTILFAQARRAAPPNGRVEARSPEHIPLRSGFLCGQPTANGGNRAHRLPARPNPHASGRDPRHRGLGDYVATDGHADSWVAANTSAGANVSSDGVDAHDHRSGGRVRVRNRS